MNVPVRELKGKLSQYLKRAAAGEEITVTSRGRPIARLVQPQPHRTGEAAGPAEIGRRLAAIPGIILGEPGKVKGSKHPIRIRKGEKTLAEIVLEDRR